MQRLSMPVPPSDLMLSSNRRTSAGSTRFRVGALVQLLILILLALVVLWSLQPSLQPRRTLGLILLMSMRAPQKLALQHLLVPENVQKS